MSKLINQLVSILLLTILISGCSSIKEIQIGDIKDVRLKSIENNLVGLELYLPVTNPGNFKIKIIDMDFDISVNGKHLGKMTNPEKIVIPSKYNNIQTFPVQIELSNFLSGALSMYRLRNMKNFEIQIKGKVKARSFLYIKTMDIDEKNRVSW
ncbi:MAG TPA: LEA type 2 family protein [Bacteroidales bacterium]|nr:LEA type 2 family protein [Bacteroidales bacterium]